MKHTLRTRGFTLVELLVVIGIIAVMISVLLPTLSGARRSAKTLGCSANLRSITQAMYIYATENNSWIPGSALTSGAPARKPFGANALLEGGVSHINDWQAPLARLLGIRFNEGPTLAERTERFVYLMSHPAFVCPENDVIATPLGTPVFPAMQAPSYMTAVQFLYEHKSAAIADGDDRVGETTTYSFHNPPPGYGPKVTKVGASSQKIFMACGGKYSDSASTAVRAPLTFAYDWGGAYGDRGPWYSANKAWDRLQAPGNGGSAAHDPRVFSYRHGQRTPFGAADSFRFNGAFFDGHVSTMGDLEGADPNMWNPKGTRIQVAWSRMYRDVTKKYYNDQMDFYTVK